MREGGDLAAEEGGDRPTFFRPPHQAREPESADDGGGRIGVYTPTRWCGTRDEVVRNFRREILNVLTKK